MNHTLFSNNINVLELVETVIHIVISIIPPECVCLSLSLCVSLIRGFWLKTIVIISIKVFVYARYVPVLVNNHVRNQREQWINQIENQALYVSKLCHDYDNFTDSFVLALKWLSLNSIKLVIFVLLFCYNIKTRHLKHYCHYYKVKCCKPNINFI